MQGIVSVDSLVIWDNDSLVNVNELIDLTTIGNASAQFAIWNNANLVDLDGLVNLVSVDADLSITDNPALDDCSALLTLLDQVDDASPGPGPGAAGIPDLNGDVELINNLTGCNSVVEILTGADLSIEVIPDFVEIPAGNTQSFDFIIFNQGPEAATNVTVNAVFDGTVDIVVLPPECGFTPGTSTLFCLLPGLAVSSGEVLQPEFLFPDEGEQTLTVTVSADQVDPHPDDNTAIVPIFVQGASGTDMAAATAILDGPNALGHILAGSTELTMSAVAVNNGPGSATGVLLEITLPGDWTLNTFDPACSSAAPPGFITLTCSLPNLPSPDVVPTTELIQFAVVPNSDGEVSVVASANEPDPEPVNNTIMLPVDVRTFSADLRVSLFDQSPTQYLYDNSQFEFEFRATVAGAEEAVSPRMLLELTPAEQVTSAQLTFSSSGTSCVDASTGSQIRWSCTADSPSTFYLKFPRIFFEVDQPGDYTATIQIDDDAAFDPDDSNNLFESTMTVLPPPPIRVRAIEVNQVVQDWHNSVSLFTGKSTLVRVFLEDDENLRKSGTGQLLGLRGGIPVAGSPLDPINSFTRIPVTSIDKRDKMSGSLNFVLPDNWTEEGELELQFVLDALGRPSNCTEPDGSPDCKTSVTFLEPVPAELDMLAVGYTTDDVQLLEFDCGEDPCVVNIGSDEFPVLVTIDGSFRLVLDGEQSAPIDIGDLMVEDKGGRRSPLLENALNGLPEFEVGDVIVRRSDMGRVDTTKRRWRISLRKKVDLPQLSTVPTDFGHSTTSVNTDIEGGVYQPPPTINDLFEQVARLQATLPVSNLNMRYVWISDFDWKPKTSRDINPVVDQYRLLQDSQCPLCRTDDLRVGAYLHGEGVEGSGGNAMNHVYSSYIAGAVTATDVLDYSSFTGPHEFAHSFRKEHAVVMLNPDDNPSGSTDDKIGLCGAIASDTALLHPHIYEIPGLTNTGLDLTDFYSSETWPTLGPIGQVFQEIWGVDSRFLTSGAASPIVDPYEVIEMMSYCYTGSGLRKWPSEYTYEQIAIGLENGWVGTPDDVGQVGDIVYVAGTIDETDTVEIAVMAGATAPMPDQEPGPLRVAFVDASDEELSAVHVALQLGDGRGDQSDEDVVEGPIPTGFVAAVPLPVSNVAALVVGDTANPLIRIEASANAPTVEILSPTMGAVITDNDLTIEWSSFDADGDQLHATVFYSSDNGDSWNTIGINLTGDSLIIPGDQLAMSVGAMVKVSVSDGIWYAEDVSEPFEVGNTEPFVAIMSPPFQESPEFKMLMHRLEAVAWDTEDGNLAPETAEWSSDVDGLIGMGSPLDVDLSVLTPGCHNISVSFMDSNAALGTDTQEICAGEYIHTNGFE
jgi:hypothetical protein